MLPKLKNNQQGIAFVFILVGIIVVLGIGLAIANVAVSNNANRTAEILEQQNVGNDAVPENSEQNSPDTESPTTNDTSNSSTTEKPSSKPPSSSPPSSPPPSSPPPPQPTTHNVGIYDDYFLSASLTIKKGDTVKWTNHGTFHDVTGGSLDSGYLNNGQTFTFMFNTVGVFNYACSVHPGMNGTITVQN